MDEKLQLAETALRAGQLDTAISHIVDICTATPQQPVHIYRVLVTQLYKTGRYEEGDAWAAKATALYPRDLELLNLHGVILRKLGRPAEGVAVLDKALKLHPGNVMVTMNRGNQLLDLADYGRAEAAFGLLARHEPRNAEYQRMLGRALMGQGKLPQAATRLKQAIALRKDYVDAWLDLIALDINNNRLKEGAATAERALAACPNDQRLIEARLATIRRAGDLRGAEAFLMERAAQFENAGWFHFQLGQTIADLDRARANVCLRRAVELEPNESRFVTALIESLERTRVGDEGAHIEESYQLAKQVLAGKPRLGVGDTKVFNDVLIRVADFDAIAQVGDFKSLGRGWAETGRHTALLKQLGAVATDEDRYELVEQHKIWGRNEEKKAQRNPIRRPPPRPKDGRIRLGFMSSDLRQHPVAYFAHPLFENLDPRFDLYCYSFYLGKEDATQTYVRERSKVFRWIPDVGIHEAAQIIADDQLDILIELGGTTHMNRLEVMAYKPAPIQASWLGYPHSAGLSTIDYYVCDPYSEPSDPALLMEKPLMLPHSWVALGRLVFSNSQPISDTLAADRNGYITFGTANNPHKYNPQTLRAWAQVTASVPNARFAFIRPEGGTASFRKNIQAAFAAEGVDESRVVFHTIRGAHMPFYNEVDITLDPFPLTGGTTTTEALWMGVPVVSLRGKAFYERLSYSLLTNVGLGDLVADDLDEYKRIAVDLANDRARRLDLHQNLRARVAESPLGQTEAFAKDFYDAVARVVEAGPVKGKR